MNEITLVATRATVVGGQAVPEGAHVVWSLMPGAQVFSLVIALPNDPGALLGPLDDGSLIERDGRSPSLLAQRIRASAGSPAGRRGRPARQIPRPADRSHLKLE